MPHSPWPASPDLTATFASSPGNPSRPLLNLSSFVVAETEPTTRKVFFGLLTRSILFLFFHSN